MKRAIAIFLGIVSVFLILAVLYGVISFLCLFGSPSEIKDGFSQELVDTLQNQYSVTVPDGAEFINGYNASGREGYLIIFFECESEDFSIYKALSIDDDTYENVTSLTAEHKYRSDSFNLGGEMHYTLKHKSIDFTSIEYRITDGKLQIRFIGYRPDNIFA